MSAHGKRDVDLFWIEGHATRHERNLVEAVRAPGAPPDSDFEIPNLARLLPGVRAAGCKPALIQGVFTPMVAGFVEL